MSGRLALYLNIIGMNLTTRVHFHDIRCLITVAWAIVGVLAEESVRLSKWGIHIGITGINGQQHPSLPCSW